MNKTFHWIALAAVTSLAIVAGCSDKNSTEACRYETSVNLDKGNYDAVLSSACADAMQLGAADFGKAGYKTTDVINRFVDANNLGGSSSAFRLYMNSLVGTVTESSLGYLDAARSEYTSVAAGSPDYSDSRFSLSLVDAVTALSYLKLFIGGINDSCDLNGNAEPDAVDAASCALYVGAGGFCDALNGSGTVTVSQDVPGITFPGKTATYRGIVVAVAGGGSSSGCPSPNEYRKLLYQSGSVWKTALTTMDDCAADNNGGTWPCPLERNGVPVDVMDAVGSSVLGSVSALGSVTTASTDVVASITTIQTRTCPGGVCSPTDFASYLQTY